MKHPKTIQPPEGRLAVLMPGLGAVATTTIAGILLARKALAEPIGSLTQLGTIRLGRRTEGRVPKVKDFVPLASLDQLEFGGWDIFPDSAYEAAKHAAVLEEHHLELVRKELEHIHPMKGVFYPEYVRRLHGTYVKTGSSKADMVEQLRDDIRTFVKRRECSRAVAIWCGSTETYLAPSAVHNSITAFEQGLKNNDSAITNSQIYAWACIKELSLIHI